MDFCTSCTEEIIRFAGLKPPADPKEEPEETRIKAAPPQTITVHIPEPEPVKVDIKQPKKPTEKEKPSEKEKREYHRLTEEQKEEAERRYREGQEMEDISKEMPCDLVALSRYIQKKGLGKERYAGQPIPSKGSAPIQTAKSVRGTI